MKLTIIIEGDFSVNAKEKLDVQVEVEGTQSLTPEQATIACGTLEMVKYKLKSSTGGN